MPKGVLFSIADLVPTLVKVVQHFEWKHFMYIGWSLGVAIGKIFDIAYPGIITRTVELDPVPAHHTWPTTREDLKDWYQYYYSYYEDGKYKKSNAGVETAPKYSYEKARELLINARGLTEEASEHAIERVLTPVADGLYRFTFDQRMKRVPVLPFSGEILQRIYTTSKTPTLGIIASQTLAAGVFDRTPFVTDPKLWPHMNYSCKVVEGGHDVHINSPELMADDIGKFLMDEMKAKL
ncbi:hypothetical protein K1T71_014459 [Dendrolimus kikuchii]|uniref:Uncharacterized protein n=1 Tax=Dendrolimus kikuchii TaxID=765133 RepID=A0ACC1CE59_9NEOP|nr:hypothetical protein K1T71_014459 [Dendrolimus kikuchii]